MPDSRELIEEQYDVLYGKLPEFNASGANQMVLVVNEYNGLSDITLALLGYLGINIPEKVTSGTDVTFDNIESISIKDVVGKEVYLATNDDIYAKYTDKFIRNLVNKEDCERLEIVGVIREKKNVSGILTTGFAYTTALTEKVLAANKNSEIAEATRAKTEKTMTVYMANFEEFPTTFTVYETLTLRQLAGVDTPSKISVYAKDFNSKEKIKADIDRWNDLCEGKENEDELKITYSDMMSMMFGMLNTMVSAVTYVLVAFTSISLVVSSVMIGIITYISVVERTKEIGVLRALGAAKGEVGSVFNAETFLIGLFAGLIGIAVTYLLSIPINLILGSLIENVGKLAVLSPVAAIVMVCISVVLTLISGIIPSRAAAKKDPVVALRSE